MVRHVDLAADLPWHLLYRHGGLHGAIGQYHASPVCQHGEHVHRLGGDLDLLHVRSAAAAAAAIHVPLGHLRRQRQRLLRGCRQPGLLAARLLASARWHVLIFRLPGQRYLPVLPDWQLAAAAATATATSVPDVRWLLLVL